MQNSYVPIELELDFWGSWVDKEGICVSGYSLTKAYMPTGRYLYIR